MYATLDSEATPIVPSAEGLTVLPRLMGAKVPTWKEVALSEISQHFVKIRDRTDPDSVRVSMYTEAYERYRQTYFALLPVFEAAAGRPV